MVFQIKICGITNPADAAAAVDAGADAIGLNFYPLSRRFVSQDFARLITTTLPVETTKVGVFVNASPADIRSIIGHVRLSAIQLHGSEPAEIVAQLPTFYPVLSAYRCDARGLAPCSEYLKQCRSCGRSPDAVLLDAAAEATDEYGGTGRVADWKRIARERDLIGNVWLVLAGGLTPDNVAEAIRIVRPHAVDVASGVESAPGKKDAAKMRDFVAAARDAFAAH